MSLNDNCYNRTPSRKYVEMLKKVTILSYHLVNLWLKIIRMQCLVVQYKRAYGVIYSSPPSAAYMRQWTGPSLVQVMAIGIDTKIEVIVLSPTTWEAHHSPRAPWEAHHSPRASPKGCGELPRSLVTPQWPKSKYQFLFYHDDSKHIKSMQIRVCIRRKSLIKLLQISQYGRHGHRTLSQQLP